MASIFTFEESPSRIISPWSALEYKHLTDSTESGSMLGHTRLSDYALDKLDPEPQEGSIEYKLHLLLRPRGVVGTARADGSSAITNRSDHADLSSTSSLHVVTTVSTPAPSTPMRQKRLEQLTTQLLWRLRQSSPHHSSNSSHLVLPVLPEGVHDAADSPRPVQLVAGLEESHGALYEIGVADDGTLIGLNDDEVEESLRNLRAMASSLGCEVKVLRKIDVSCCDQHEPMDMATPKPSTPQALPSHSLQEAASLGYRQESGEPSLWVVEAMVVPGAQSTTSQNDPRSLASNARDIDVVSETARLLDKLMPSEDQRDRQYCTPEEANSTQLRITLAGPSGSGKSSLLGVLTMSTLDNGRGKSRLSLLKHRHEIESGLTSSVAQELFGYTHLQVVNYAGDDIASWTDIHANASKRLVFVSDTAGHPRYRRTIIRGLLGWAPHYVVFCMTGDSSSESSGSFHGILSNLERSDNLASFPDLSTAQLRLCLRLGIPMILVITKLDAVPKTSLRQTLARILSMIKTTGRTPVLIPPDTTNIGISSSDLIGFPELQEELAIPASNLRGKIPIILTSAVNGTGLQQLHALLSRVPLPKSPVNTDYTGAALNPEQPSSLFHIEDVYGLSTDMHAYTPTGGDPGLGNIVSGHVRFGALQVDDYVVVGPFPADYCLDKDDIASDMVLPEPGHDSDNQHSDDQHFPASDSLRSLNHNAFSASAIPGEWFRARIVSIRNLRRPVRVLRAGQVGTLAILFDDRYQAGAVSRIRKGMVTARPSDHMVATGLTLQSARGFTAVFHADQTDTTAIGSLVVVYIASIRASAKVMSMRLHEEDVPGSKAYESSSPMGLDNADASTNKHIDVTFELMTSREWIELGSQVLCMPGGGQGLYDGSGRRVKGIADFDGFVGSVIELVG